MLSSIGVLTVSTSRVVMVMLRSHRLSRWRSTFVPCTPILAMVPPGGDDFLAHLERGRNAHRLDGRVDAALAGHLHDRLHGLAVGAVDGRRRAEALGHLEAVVVEIDHDDLGRRIELGGEQRGEADRPRADDRHGAARLQPCR